METTGIKPVRIDAEFARLLLEMNTNNRPKNQRAVKAYAADMAAGKWKLNGETIKVTGDGIILDGQHRLEACVMSGVPFDTYFVEVEDSTSFDTIDIGRKRTGSDVLTIKGEINTCSLSATLNMICEFEANKKIPSSSIRKRPSEIESALERHPEVRASIAFASKNQKACQALMTRAVAAFCHYIFSRIDATDAQTFMDQVLSGENLQRNDPAWALRNRLMIEQAQKRKGAIRTSYLTALVIKAWNYYRSGKPCTVLKYLETEDFPVPK